MKKMRWENFQKKEMDLYLYYRLLNLLSDLGIDSASEAATKYWEKHIELLCLQMIDAENRNTDESV